MTIKRSLPKFLLFPSVWLGFPSYAWKCGIHITDPLGPLQLITSCSRFDTHFLTVKGNASTNDLYVEVDMTAAKVDLQVSVVSDFAKGPLSDATVRLDCTDPEATSEYTSEYGEEDEEQPGRYLLQDALPWAGQGSCKLNVEKDGQVKYIQGDPYG